MSKKSTFSIEDIKSAKNLVIKYAELLDKSEDDYIEEEGHEDAIDEFLEFAKNEPYFKAIATQFLFNFPKNVYGNRSENVTNGVNSPALFKSTFASTFSICLFDKNNSEPDAQVSHILRYVLPEWLEFDDEYHVSISKYMNPPADITVQNLYDLLISMGFEYTPNGTEDWREECLFKDNFK